MNRFFAVIRSRGPAWNTALPMEQQPDWRQHADFMTALAAEGFVSLAGPLEGSDDVLPAVRATDAKEIGSRLAHDCWSGANRLRINWKSPSSLRLGSLNPDMSAPGDSSSSIGRT